MFLKTMTVLVRNKRNSEGSGWLKKWEEYMHCTANECAVCGERLTNDQRNGAHVYKVHPDPQTGRYVASEEGKYYIVPLFKKHNNSENTEVMEVDEELLVEEEILRFAQNDKE